MLIFSSRKSKAGGQYFPQQVKKNAGINILTTSYKMQGSIFSPRRGGEMFSSEQFSGPKKFINNL